MRKNKMTLEDLDRELDFVVYAINTQKTYFENHPGRNNDTAIMDAIYERNSVLKTALNFRESLQNKIEEFKSFQKTLWRIGVFADSCGRLICRDKEIE